MCGASDILKHTFGFTQFRGQQAAIIEHVAMGGHALVVMPTGGGKSLCYQIPALMRTGMGVVISPLIALMHDQVAALHELNIPAAYLNSSLSPKESHDVMQAAQAGQIKLLYVAPERVVMPSFLAWLSRCSVALFAIDEAHCVSQWGHDFRPEYRLLSVLTERFAEIPRLALTATADARTQAEIRQVLSLERAPLFAESLARSNLKYRVVEKHRAREQLLQFIRTEYPQQSGIVYCLSRRRVDEVTAWLCQHGVMALPYHAGLSPEVRRQHQQRFLHEQNCVVVATVAFGMGIDKPDVRFVAHLDVPRSLEHFYQESGRAGRDGLPATSWLCYGLSDFVQWQYFLRQPLQDSNLYSNEYDDACWYEVFAYCETQGCRQQALLAHFDESSPPCGRCDNCLQRPEVYDATEAAQKVLSCIYRTQQQAGIDLVIDILRGRETVEVRARAFELLSTFGVGRDGSQRWWRSVIRQLLAARLVCLEFDLGSPRLCLTAESRAVLKGERCVMLRALARTSRLRRGEYSGIWRRTERQERVWQALLAWRREQALARDVPNYAIFTDATLRELVEKQPKNLAELADISGIGEAKLAHYGVMILEILRREV